MKKSMKFLCKLDDHDFPSNFETPSHSLSPEKPSKSHFLTSKSPEKLLLFCEKPIETRFLKKKLENDDDLSEFHRVSEENCDLFSFDRVFSPKDSSESLFLTIIKPLISQLFIGKNSAVLIAGNDRFY